MKATKLTEGTMNALNALRAQDGVTLNQLNEGSEVKVASAQLTSLVKRGLVSTEKVEVPVTRMTEVNVYTLTEAGVNYTEEEETPAE